MSFAEKAAAWAKPPDEKEITFLLAHFSFLLSEEKLILAVQRSAKIIPYGIDTHPRGMLLAFRSPSDSQKILEATQGSLRIDSKIIPLTPWPEIKTPPKERGRRWRISGVPLTVSKEILLEKLNQLTPITEVKLESVRNFPTCRTSFVTFWCSDRQFTPPKTLEIKQGTKSRIFDPVRIARAQEDDTDTKESERTHPTSPRPSTTTSSTSEIPKFGHPTPASTPVQTQAPTTALPKIERSGPSTPSVVIPASSISREIIDPQKSPKKRTIMEEGTPPETPTQPPKKMDDKETPPKSQVYIYTTPAYKISKYSLRDPIRALGFEYEMYDEGDEVWVCMSRPQPEDIQFSGPDGMMRTLTLQKGWPKEFKRPLYGSLDFLPITYSERIPTIHIQQPDPTQTEEEKLKDEDEDDNDDN